MPLFAVPLSGACGGNGEGHVCCCKKYDRNRTSQMVLELNTHNPSVLNNP